MEIHVALGQFLVIKEWAQAKFALSLIGISMGGRNAIGCALTNGEGIRKPIFDKSYGGKRKIKKRRYREA